MVQIAALVLGFPLGYFIRKKPVAFGVLAVLLGVLLIPQTIGVNNDGHVDAAYWVVQAITFAVGYGLVTWGAYVARRRRTADTTPAGMRIASAMTIAMQASSSVTGTFSAISVRSGCCVRSDSPRSPCSTPRTQYA